MTRTFRFAARRGFTLIELLMVIVVITILIGLLLPVLQPSKESAKRRQKELEEKALIAALKAYKLEEMTWPKPSPEGWKTYEEDNCLVVKLLEGANSANMRYLNKGTFNRDSQGSVKDPYGVYYSITVSETNAVVNDQSAKD
ncbi:MAG: type II secretion system protein [Verrucomicrobiota bacterium]|nr:type II secretion system protein [Verrucomicrobiota bacterium]